MDNKTKTLDVEYTLKKISNQDMQVCPVDVIKLADGKYVVESSLNQSLEEKE